MPQNKLSKIRKFSELRQFFSNCDNFKIWENCLHRMLKNKLSCCQMAFQSQQNIQIKDKIVIIRKISRWGGHMYRSNFSLRILSLNVKYKYL